MVTLITERRSVREGFTRQPVPRAVLEEIVACGLSAPSSKNAQPWRFHVVTREAMLSEFADAVQSAKDAARYVPVDPATGEPRAWTSTVAASAQTLRTCAAAIFVENCGRFSDGRRAVAASPDEHRENAVVGYGFELIGIGAAIENMWLAASAHGLAAVFMGDVLVVEEELRVRLEVDGDLVGVLALGFSDEPPFPKQLAEGTVRWHGEG